ncbi:synaptobrevin [Hokovirus HKV1]|uniref:Synaptobrevin n=1 Tax=Hokovirus HKV1 TaxID=1977638 RepID=A0A1V0SF60_9VIRU|nr:synaptobrevin [Hokovirus HKV1]
MCIVYASIYDTKLIANYNTIANLNQKNNLDIIITELVNNNIDFSVNHRKIFKASPRTYNYGICFEVRNNKLYICLVNNESYKIYMNFLKNIANDYEKFMGNHNDDIISIQELIRNNINYYNDPKNDPLGELQQKIDELKDITNDNIRFAITRGENLDHLNEKTRTLNDHANHFRVTSKKLRCQMIKENMTVTFWLVLILFVMLSFMVCIIIIVMNTYYY